MPTITSRPSLCFGPLAALALASLLASSPALADPPRAVIEQAATARLQARAAAVQSCAFGRTEVAVDVRFQANGVLGAVSLGAGAPPAVSRCVADALAGVALPGAVADGTIVRHVFRFMAPPPPAVQAPPPPPRIVATPPPPPRIVAAPPPPPRVVAAPPPPPRVVAAPPPPPRVVAAPPAPVVTAPPRAVVSSLEVAPAPGPVAEPMPPAPPPPPDVGWPAPPAVTATTAPAPEDSPSGRFSIGRYFLEVLVGGAVGSALSYGIYSAMCDGNDCFDAALAGLGVNIAATPLAIWGVGRIAGGRGDLLYTYIGGMTAFAGSASPDDAVVAVTIGVILMPLTAALLFELTSHMTAGRSATGVALGPNLTAGLSPIYGRGGVEGGTLTLGGTL